MRLRPVIASTGMIAFAVGAILLMGGGLMEIAIIALGGVIIVPLQYWVTKKLWEDDDF